MSIPKAVIKKLADAWMEEARRLRSGAICDCGCEELITLRKRFKPGHDAKLLKTYKAKIAAILESSR